MPRPLVQISNSHAELASLGLEGGESEFTRSERATVRFLGANLSKIQESLGLLKARVKNETLSPELCDFLRPILEAATPDAASDLSLVIRWTTGKMHVGYSALPTGFALPLALFWLPALRTFWERTLRRSHYFRLTRLLPRAWFFTTDAPPPGAVIPGLQITSWSQLTSDHGSFWWTQDAAAAELVSAAGVTQRISSGTHPTSVILIEEQIAMPEAFRIRASYRMHEKRLHLGTLTFLPPSKDASAS